MISDISVVSGAARSLSRNPLGIIALFIVLIYGFAALTLAANNALSGSERLPLVWFLVIFPVVVLGAFCWLVSQHHEKLYAPGDYKSDDSFLSAAAARVKHASEVTEQNTKLKVRVQEVLRTHSKGGQVKVEEAISRVTAAIDEATYIKVDFDAIPQINYSTASFPVAAFESFGELTDAIYFEIEDVVRPFEYGFTWILRNCDSGKVIKSARMITGAPPGARVADSRTLSEVGIRPGSRLAVELIKQ